MTSIEDLTNVIIPHFCKYPLLTQKQADFELFRRLVEFMNHKEHLTTEGLHKILSIRATINKGLPKRLEAAFPNITPEPRPQVTNPTLESNSPEVKHWIAGFVSGEGCLFIKTSKSKTHRLGMSVALNFLVVQNVRDANLLESFVQVFGCGSFSISSF